MDPIAWSILCCVLMVVAVGLEMLTPSFGFFTLVAVGLMAGSAWFAFASSSSAGFVMIGANVTLFPISIFLGMKLLKHSPLLHTQEIHAGVPHEPPSAKPAHELVGKEGHALTPLRPAGTAQVGEARLDVVTEGKFVDAGQPVKVLRVDGNIVVVEPLG